MDTLTFIFQILLWPLCLLIIGLILLQGGAGDLSSAFGGGGQLDSTLGVGAGRKMSKLTAWLAVIFLAIITFLSRSHGGHVGEKTGGAAGTQAMSAPAANREISGLPLQAPAAPAAPVSATNLAPAAAPDAAAPAAANPPAPDANAPDAKAPAAGDANAAPADAKPAAPAAAPAPAKLKLDDARDGSAR